MPADPGRRAVWAGALLNPLPALGVAMEVKGAKETGGEDRGLGCSVRPRLLMARSVSDRLAVAHMGFRTSIQQLEVRAAGVRQAGRPAGYAAGRPGRQPAGQPAESRPKAIRKLSENIRKPSKNV